MKNRKILFFGTILVSLFLIGVFIPTVKADDPEIGLGEFEQRTFILNAFEMEVDVTYRTPDDYIQWYEDETYYQKVHLEADTLYLFYLDWSEYEGSETVELSFSQGTLGSQYTITGWEKEDRLIFEVETTAWYYMRITCKEWLYRTDWFFDGIGYYTIPEIQLGEYVDQDYRLRMEEFEVAYIDLNNTGHFFQNNTLDDITHYSSRSSYYRWESVYETVDEKYRILNRDEGLPQLTYQTEENTIYDGFNPISNATYILLDYKHILPIHDFYDFPEPEPEPDPEPDPEPEPEPELPKSIDGFNSILIVGIIGISILTGIFTIRKKIRK